MPSVTPWHVSDTSPPVPVVTLRPWCALSTLVGSPSVCHSEPLCAPGVPGCLENQVYGGPCLLKPQIINIWLYKHF